MSSSDIRYPRERKPHYSRTVIGPIESAPPWRDILVSGQVILPIPIGDIGELFVSHRPRRWATNPPTDAFEAITYETIGGPGQVVCRPEVFHYRMTTYGQMWQEEVARDHIERQIRHVLAEAIADRYIINMEASLA